MYDVIVSVFKYGIVAYVAATLITLIFPLVSRAINYICNKKIINEKFIRRITTIGDVLLSKGVAALLTIVLISLTYGVIYLMVLALGLI